VPESLPWTGDAEADRLLARNPFALLMGMLLDQQFPMERAFYGPYLLGQRSGQAPTPETVAAIDPDELETMFKGPPAIHRYPGSMAKRTRELANHVLEDYDGDTARIWRSAGSGKELLARLKALPGFGEAKARIFLGVIGKRLGEGPPGWEQLAADWPSIADVASFADVAQLREQKRLRKAAGNA
jgi:uncharacterized HhH-GPD family protein